MHVVLTTAPPDAAESLASKLVTERLAACVNIVPHIVSTYRWKGAVEREQEALLVIKTSDEALARLMHELPALHPYDVPEIVALAPHTVHAAYAEWVQQETSPVKDR